MTIDQETLLLARKELLKKLASNIAIRFYSPIYLVGSYVERPLEALDVDIIMVMTEARVLRLFDSKDFNQRRFNFIWKQKKHFEDCFNWADVDFKIQTLEEFAKFQGPREKLDKWVEVPR